MIINVKPANKNFTNKLAAEIFTELKTHKIFFKLCETGGVRATQKRFGMIFSSLINDIKTQLPYSLEYNVQKFY